MKIKEQIRVISLLALALMSFSKALANPAEEHTTAAAVSVSSTESPVETLAQLIHNGSAQSDFRWTQLEQFQQKLWRAMALDPAPYILVPLAQVPKHLFAFALNEELVKEWAEVKKSTFPKDFRAEFEFNQYAQTVDSILSYRGVRQFPRARAIAKRGILEQNYSAVVKKMGSKTESGARSFSATQIAQFETAIQAIKEQLNQAAKPTDKKSVFSGGGKFIWLSFMMVIGFFLGVATYRFNPHWFTKMLDQSVGSTTLEPAQKLDYAHWLQTFESSLQKLKLSQIVHEKRIEELVINSEKIHQHSLSLYSDARIKNEANLEHRMSTLIKEIHHQIDQGKKLQAGDRVQIQTMLEHCLELCDAVENGAITVDSAKLLEPIPPISPAKSA